MDKCGLFVMKMVFSTLFSLAKNSTFVKKSEHRAPWFTSKQGVKMMVNHHFTVKNEHRSKNTPELKKGGVAINRYFQPFFRCHRDTLKRQFQP